MTEGWIDNGDGTGHVHWNVSNLAVDPTRPDPPFVPFDDSTCSICSARGGAMTRKFVRLMCPDHPDRDVDVPEDSTAWCRCGKKMVTVEEFEKGRVRAWGTFNYGDET